MRPVIKINQVKDPKPKLNHYEICVIFGDNYQCHEHLTVTKDGDTLSTEYYGRKYSVVPKNGDKFVLHKGIKVLCLKVVEHDCKTMIAETKRVQKEISTYLKSVVRQLKNN